MIRRLMYMMLAALALAALVTRPALAGPPYVTDDPDPTAYRHFEIYVLTTYDVDTSHTVAANLPAIEINYGLMPNVQFSVTLPLAGASATGGPLVAGFGDTEVALKMRFMQERPGRPQASFYPAVVLPTGNASLGLGAGLPKLFLPVWAQKTNGAWTYFGGGGVWHNPGTGNRDYTLLGLAATRQVRDGLDLGAEVYHQSPDTVAARSQTGVGLGFVAERGELHAVLASIGRGVQGTNTFHAYAAYELYLGPREKGTVTRPER